MIRRNGAIFFDVDGVLLNSLPPHLRICRDKAIKYDLSIDIPNEDDFIEIVSTGQPISPMFEFFKTVGFPKHIAGLATQEYELEFMEFYRPEVFFGVHSTISAIHKCGWTLGIVTSNVYSNIYQPLRPSINKFDADCIFTRDNTEGKNKSWCLVEGARRLGFRPADCFYVGDLPSDAEAAKDAGFRFIAAMYGWGLRKDVGQSYNVASVEEIPDVIGC